MYSPRFRPALVGVLTGLLLSAASAQPPDRIWLDASQAAVPAVQPLADPRDPALDVRNLRADGLEVSLALPGLIVDTRDTKVGRFAQLSWPDSAVTGDFGAPAIPVLRKLFLVPPGADVAVTCVEPAPMTIDLAALGLPARLLPVQPPIEKLPGAREAAPFALDAVAYALDADLPAARAVVEELGTVRGQRLMALELRPIAYNAAAGTLTLWPRLDASVTFIGGAAAANPETLPGLDSLILNPGPAPRAQSGVGNLLVIVASAFESGIAPFTQAKSGQGYTVTTWTAAPGTTNTAIKNYIASLYAVPATRPDYVLLVGDTNTIPHWTGGGEGYPATDLPYGCMEGAADWFPDIAIGRFPVRTLAQLTNVLDKTLDFENEVFADPGYLTRAVFMASNDNYPVSEGTHNWVINNYMIPNDFTYDRLYCHTYNATTAQVRAAFNDGRIYGIYSGHGSEYSWADGPPFSQTDVRNLYNTRLYPFVASFACVTGTYTLTECFTETWILEPAKGAIAIWGSSVNSYWTEDDVLEKEMFRVLYDDYVREIGPCLNATRLRYAAIMGTGSTTRRYFEMYNLLGDPSLYIPDADAALRVTPPADFYSEGDRGGPFAPSEITYRLSNMADYAIDYAVTHDPDCTWLTLAGELTGDLRPGETADILVQLNENAALLVDGGYTDTIAFTNLTDHVGDTTRSVTLHVGVPQLIHSFPLDENPGWVTLGQWAFGRPTGGGSYGRDPTSGHTGLNVYGYNLAGDYTNNMPEYTLTSPPLNCANRYDVELRFWRWLGVESANYDQARVQVSVDGKTFITVWEHSGASISDTAWQQMRIDISALADNRPKVWLRWTMGPTDSSITYPGWNIDDVELWALVPPADPCDFDGDGDVDLDDFARFATCFNGPGAPPAPGCTVEADFDHDGDVDLNDFAHLMMAFTGGV